MVALALDHGGLPSQWWAEDERDLATALDIRRREAERDKPKRSEGGVVTSG